MTHGPHAVPVLVPEPIYDGPSRGLCGDDLVVRYALWVRLHCASVARPARERRRSEPNTGIHGGEERG